MVRFNGLSKLFITFLLCAPQAQGVPLSASLGGYPRSTQERSPYAIDLMRRAKAFSLHNYMNESADPCENFYDFACGRWSKINPANALEHLTTGLFEEMSKALDRKVNRTLHEDVDTGGTPIDKKVRDFYVSCTKIKNLRDTYKQKLVNIIAEFGEMPALVGSSWREEAFDWLSVVAKISRRYGTDIIIGLDIMADYSDNTVNRVYIGHPEFPLESKSMYLDPSTSIYRQSYRDKIAKELREYLQIEAQLAADTARDIVDFEVQLAKGMIDETLGQALDEISRLRYLDDIQKDYAPVIDIKKLVNITLGETLTEEVYEYADQYQINLKQVLSETPKRIVANYIFYTLLDDFLLEEVKTSKGQKRTCIEKTKSYFAKNVDNMVYRKYQTNNTVHDIELMWKELKDSFKAKLGSDELKWISSTTRRKAAEKLDAMKLEINSYADHNFTEEYGELEVNDYDYVENIKNILALASNQSLSQLHKPPKPLEAGEILSYTPANIILENKIKVPVSLLQPNSLWSDIYPNALKFGTLGALVGHELIHGFDDSGRTFDKDGNNKNWWDEESTKTFVKRTECFTNQYSKYKYGKRNLPRSVSQSENIADNGGVRVAYSAYMKWLRSTKLADLRLETLPTLNYTSEQLFFISFAQVWCNDAHPRIKDLQTSTDQHVPGEFRVIGSLSNFQEFSTVFKCGPTTRMNPRTKCIIY